MKTIKTFFAITVAFVSISFAASAQQSSGKVSLQDFHFREGNNIAPMKGDAGTVRFTYRNGQFLNVMHQDAAGRITRLTEPTEPTANNPNPIPSCKGVEHCVINTETNTMVCFCMPDNLSAGQQPTTILIGLLLPAVQKIRQAAN